MGVLGREYEMGAVETSCMLHNIIIVSLPFLSPFLSHTLSAAVPNSQRAKKKANQEKPSALTAVVFAVVGNHKHDLPLEDVGAHETATSAGAVLVALHELELAGQEPGGC